MTATINESATAAPAAGGVGRVSRVIGPVVDVEFSADTMPEVYNLLTLEVSLNGEKKNINLEVAQHIGDSMVRAISLQPTDGIVRGSEVRDSGGPISVPVGDGLVISPADGVVSHVGPVRPPEELELGAEPLVRVSIFMNVFNCHVNRAPVGGKIVRVAYRAGKFLNAELDKASDDNERNGLVIDHNGTNIGVVQIAGLVARRIVCFVKEGENLSVGERFGLIRFGSRLDVYFPAGTVPKVALGQTMIAGETVLADLNQPQAPAPTLTRVS